MKFVFVFLNVAFVFSNFLVWFAFQGLHRFQTTEREKQENLFS